MKDLFGTAILDFQTNNSPENLITKTTISDEDEMSVAYLFRNFNEMPKIEQQAMQLSKGKILDVGCGAGSHSLYLQNEKQLDITAIDISENAIKTCLLRGLKNAQVQDVMTLENQKFDTILLMMNGGGMCGKLKKLPQFLIKLKTLLNPNGQILLDSSDILYMFDEDEKAEKLLSSTNSYYGEVVFHITYKGKKEKPFIWMYIDFLTLKKTAENNGFQCEMLLKGEHFDYLARLF